MPGSAVAYPEVINVAPRVPDQPPFPPQLGGLSFHGAEPALGNALVALGVEPEQVSNWTIYSGRPEGTDNSDTADSTTIVIQPDKIAEQMLKLSRHRRDSRIAYVEAFKPAASKVILTTLAAHVAQQRPRAVNRRIEKEVYPLSHRSVAGIVVGFTVVTSYVAGVVGEPEMAVPIAIGGALGAGVQLGASHQIARAISPELFNRQYVLLVAKRNPQLLPDIERSILPKFTSH